MRLNWIDKTEIQFWRDNDGGAVILDEMAESGRRGL